MADDKKKRQGTPNWADCATTDLDGAEAFYAEVFGWEAERVTSSDGAVYSLQRLGGKMVAGLYALTDELKSMGVPPHWATYIEVDDVAETLARVEPAGGTVLEGPSSEEGVGTFAIIQDNVGAYLRLWHSAPEHGGEVFNIPGAMTWNELATNDVDASTAFYEAVLGVEAQAMEGPTPYTTLNAGGEPVAGLLAIRPEMGDFPPTWDVYFASDDVDATVEAALAAGGALIRPAFDLPVGGRMAVIADPYGAVFEVIRMEMPEG
ncbi:MAG: VOC family protein [Paracoccaceae bacterium]|nr:VOC family protein [Paracoccaceae bacterium]